MAIYIYSLSKEPAPVGGVPYNGPLSDYRRLMIMNVWAEPNNPRLARKLARAMVAAHLGLSKSPWLAMEPPSSHFKGEVAPRKPPVWRLAGPLPLYGVCDAQDATSRSARC